MKERLKINGIRANILRRLKKGSKAVMNLYWDVIGSSGRPISWANCYYHLTVMEKIGLVERLKEDDRTEWRLTDKGHTVLNMYE